TDIVGKPCFPGERFEDGGDAADGLAVFIRRIEIVHLAGAIMFGRGILAECETVADKKNRLGPRANCQRSQYAQRPEQIFHAHPLCWRGLYRVRRAIAKGWRRGPRTHRSSSKAHFRRRCPQPPATGDWRIRTELG